MPKVTVFNSGAGIQTSSSGSKPVFLRLMMDIIKQPPQQKQKETKKQNDQMTPAAHGKAVKSSSLSILRGFSFFVLCDFTFFSIVWSRGQQEKGEKRSSTPFPFHHHHSVCKCQVQETIFLCRPPQYCLSFLESVPLSHERFWKLYQFS